MNEMLILGKLDVIHHQLSILMGILIAKEMRATGQLSDEDYNKIVSSTYDQYVKTMKEELGVRDSR